MPKLAGIFHGYVGIALSIAGFITFSILLGLISSMRDQVLRAAPLNSTELPNLLEAKDLVHTWSKHCRLFPTSRLRLKAKFAVSAAVALITFGIVLLFLGI
jgi:hypothetical protein